MRRDTAVTACLLDCGKFLDNCKFDKLFQKLISKGSPALVFQVLVFVYDDDGCVKLGEKKSSMFRINNGTRSSQASVLSPILFYVYLDDLLTE